MMASLKLVLVLALALASVTSAVIHKECASENQIKFHKLDISPHPIKLPGSLSLAYDIEVLTDLENLNIEIKLEKKFGFRWVKMPCVQGIGSCSYDDICSVLSTVFEKGCPAEMDGLDYTCTCPFPPKRFSGETQPIEIEDVPEEIARFTQGKYRARIEVTSGTTTLACHQFEVHFA